MKTTILVVLKVVVFATPCLAQEVEPNGIFSLHGTWWRTGSADEYYGFYFGKMYICGYEEGTLLCHEGYIFSFTFNFLLFSIVYQPYTAFSGWTHHFIFLFPSLSIGWEFSFNLTAYPTVFWGPFILTKINDNWTPPGVE